MSIEDAIKILNQHRHRSASDWALNVHGEVAPEGSGVRMDYFTQDEAIAVARAYGTRGCFIFAVVCGNYEPDEVDSLWVTPEPAAQRAEQLGGMWTVKSRYVFASVEEFERAE